MLPPSRAGMPAVTRIWWISAAVVDLPLVPVTPTTLCGGSPLRACANSSMSPMTGMRSATARAKTGASCGTPGETTIAASPLRSAVWRSVTAPPNAARAPSPSSHASTVAPLATSAATTDLPVRASPNTP